MTNTVDNEKSTPLLTLLDRYNKSKIKEVAYYILFSIVYIRAFYYTTMIPGMFRSNKLVNLAGYSAAGLLLIMAAGEILSMIMSKRIRTAILLSAMICIGLVSSIAGDDRGIILLCVVLVAGIGKDMRTILKLSVILGIAVMATAYILSVSGYITYLVYDKSGGGLYHAFGCIYRTDFAAHVMYLMMSYMWLRKDKLTSIEYAALWFLPWFCWRYAGAKNNVFSMVLLLVSFIVIKLTRLEDREWPKLLKWNCLVHLLCTIGTLAAVFVLGSGLISVNAVEGTDTLWSRYNLTMTALKKYGVSLFGKVIEERGAGGVPDTSKAYFYLDISYIRILIKFGILFLLIYLVLMTMNSYYATASRDAVLALILVVIAINCLVEHHAWEFCYNIFLVTGMTFIVPGGKNNTRGDTVIEEN